MPTIDENRTQWDQQYDWISAGNEWSSHWGGTETEWRSTIFPRIWGFVPTGTICEIAPGYGRWSKYLIPAVRAVHRCRSVVVVCGGLPRPVLSCSHRERSW